MEFGITQYGYGLTASGIAFRKSIYLSRSLAFCLNLLHKDRQLQRVAKQVFRIRFLHYVIDWK
jgi:hypothetical protein